MQQAKAIFIQNCQFYTNVIALSVIMLSPVISDVRIANSKFYCDSPQDTTKFIRIPVAPVKTSIRFWNTTFVTIKNLTVFDRLNFSENRDSILLIEDGNDANIDLVESYYASGKLTFQK